MQVWVSPASGALPVGLLGAVSRAHGARRGQGRVRRRVSVGPALAVTATVLPSASGTPSVPTGVPPPPGPVTLGQRPGRLEILILF